MQEEVSKLLSYLFVGVFAAVIMADSTHLPVGDSGHSYRCISDQIISFNNDSFFYMNMTIRNVQLQAYNVNGSQYSPGM